jgi:hypothetical protein
LELPIYKTSFVTFLGLNNRALDLIKHYQKPLRNSSLFLALHPILGEDGLLRLGDRIEHAKLLYDVLHKPLLPSCHQLTEHIINIFHEEAITMGTIFPPKILFSSSFHNQPTKRNENAASLHHQLHLSDKIFRK